MNNTLLTQLTTAALEDKLLRCVCRLSDLEATQIHLGQKAIAFDHKSLDIDIMDYAQTDPEEITQFVVGSLAEGLTNYELTTKIIDYLTSAHAGSHIMADDAYLAECELVGPCVRDSIILDRKQHLKRLCDTLVRHGQFDGLN